ncbi:MAG: hypothetical protein ACP5FN_01055 [Candidatus Micrarchaeia archaeon]
MENERVIGYIDNLTSFGIITPARRSIIITDKRLLILKVSDTSSNATYAGFTYVFGIFGRGIANKITKENIENETKKLAQMNPDDALKSNPDNFSLNNEDILAIKIDRNNIQIETNSKKYKYRFSNPDIKDKRNNTYNNYVQALRTVFNDKVKAK